MDQLASEPLDGKYASRKIIYNWKENKTNDFSSDEENLQESESLDFEKLLKQASSIGGHFVFKSEKKWESDEVEETNKYSKKYFNLDPKLLNLSILSLPFYKRHEFEFFEEEEKTKMNKQAETYEQQYMEALEKSLNDNLIKQTTDNTLKSAIVEKIASLEIKEPKKPNPPIKGSEDIQQWLDDILDI